MTADEDELRQKERDNSRLKRLEYDTYGLLLGRRADRPSRRTLKDREFRYVLDGAFTEPKQTSNANV